jgi:hypothetical protein
LGVLAVLGVLAGGGMRDAEPPIEAAIKSADAGLAPERLLPIAQTRPEGIRSARGASDGIRTRARELRKSPTHSQLF